MTHKITIIRLIAVNRIFNRHEALKNMFAVVKQNINVCFRMGFLTNIPVFSLISLRAFTGLNLSTVDNFIFC